MTRKGTEPTFPYPPRFRWLKRLSAAGVAVLVLLVLLRLAWGWSASRRLEAARASVIAGGGPVRAEDLNPAPPPPDATNAAWHYGQAFRALKPGVNSPSGSMLAYESYPPYPAAWHRLAEAAYAANQPAFALARAARPHNRVDWGTRYATPIFNAWGNLPQLTQSRELANQLGDAALLSHVRGHDGQALEFVRDVRHLARAVDGETWLVHHLTGIGVEALGLARLMAMTPGLTVTDGPAPATGAAASDGPATRGQVQALIGELLGDPPPGRATAATVTGAEYLLGRDTLRWVARKNWVILPAVDDAEVRLARRAARTAAAMTQPTRASALALLPPDTREGGGSVSLDAMLGIYQPMNERMIDLDLRILAERRMAAAALAARLYRLDNNRWPGTLDDLLPRYLPAVPADPFRSDSGPLGYALATGPIGAKRPVVYHVSEDGRDDTAAGAAIPPEPLYSSHTSGAARGRASLDQWRDLTRFTPPPPADDGTEPDTEGDATDETEMDLPRDDAPGGLNYLP